MTKGSGSRRPSLSRDEVVRAAIDLTEKDGVDSLSMRRLGNRLGASAMAMYRYLPSREALLDAMVGHVLASVAIPEAGAPWGERLRAIAQGLLEAAHDNPTVFVMVLSRAYRADDAVAVMAAMYQILTDAGVSRDLVPRVERMISTALIGFAIAASSEAFWEVDPTLSAGGLTVPPDEVAATNRADRRHHELDRNVDDLIALVRSMAASRGRA